MLSPVVADLGRAVMDFTTAVANVGMAGACLLALGYACWWGIRWTGTEILKPLITRHVSFLDELSQAVTCISQAVQTQTAQQERMERLMEQVLERQEGVLRATGQTVPRKPEGDA